MKNTDDTLKQWPKPEREPQAEPQRWGVRSYDPSAHAASRAVTPSTMLTLMRDADAGNIVAQSAMFEHMEESDGDLLGLLLQRKNGALSCTRQVVPGDDSGAAQKAADFCEGLVDTLPSWGDRLLDLADAIPKGFATLEILWETSERQWAPRNLVFRPQRWWTLDDVDQQKLLLLDRDEMRGREVNPRNFITHVHRAMSGSLSRAGLCRACARPFVIRNFTIKDWLVLAEVFGQPLRVGKLPPNATTEQSDLMWAALQSLGTDAYGMIPDGAELLFPNVQGLTGNADIFDRLQEVGLHAMQMAVLGQTLTSGGESGGSYSLGQVHERVRFDLVTTDARRLDETLSGFFANVTDLNFAPGTPQPRHVTTVRQPQDRQADSEVLLNLRQAGLPISKLWVYERFDIPAPEDGDELLEAPTPAAPGFGAGANSDLVANTDSVKKKSPPAPAAAGRSVDFLS